MPDAFTGTGFVAAMLIVLLAATIASVIFPRLFGKGEDALEKRLLGRSLRVSGPSASFLERITWHGDIEPLLSELHELLTRSFRSKLQHHPAR